MTDERRPWTAPQVMAAVAVVLAVAGAVWLLVWPCPYRVIVVTSTAEGVEDASSTCRSLLEGNDTGAVVIFLVPVVLAVVGLVAARTGRRGVFIASAVLQLLFCFLGTLSVGLWFVPSAIAMLVGVAWMARPGRRPRRA
jgi:hypothetical protein